MPIVKVQVTDTSTNTDRFSGTDLERMPGPGVYKEWAASTVNTATLTKVIGTKNIMRSQAVPLTTNGMPSLLNDAPMVVKEVAGGEKNVSNIGGTVGTYSVIGIWEGEDLADV